MGRMSKYLEMVKSSQLLAPNLKEMSLKVYTGRANPGNQVARLVVRDHLAALRWMNPNAVIYLREFRGQGVPEIELSLWVGEEDKKSRVMEITSKLTPEEVVAKVMMAARDPDLDTAVAASAAAGTTELRLA